MRKYQIIYLIVFVCFISNLYLIAKAPFLLPETIKKPLWFDKIDWSNPNIYTIDSIIASYGSIDNFEEPYKMEYLRWRNQMSPFIQQDGSIVYNSNLYQDNFESIKKNNKEKNTIQAALGDWRILGPKETFWDNNNGKAAEQVNIYQIAISHSNPNVLYCASETGVIFKSTNKGKEWVSVSDGLPALGISAILIHPKYENVVYCYAQGYGLLLTTNGGKNWDLNKNYIGNGGEKIEINTDIDRLYITGDKSLYYSDDGGTTWLESTGSKIDGYYYDLTINYQDANVILAIGESKNRELILMRSNDAGKSYNQINLGLGLVENTGSRFGVSESNSNIIYILALGNTTGPKILKSIDAGSTWKVTASSTNTTLGGGGGTKGLNMSNGQGYYDMDIMVDPYNANNVICGTTSTYKSTDGGVNFSPLGGYAGGNFGIHVDLQCARAYKGDSYLTTDGAANYSSDFFTKLENWSIINNGLTGSDFWGFGQGWDEDIVVGGRYHNGNTAIMDKYQNGNALGLGGGESATGHVFIGKERTVGFNDIGTYKIPESLNERTIGAEINNTLWPQDDYYGLFNSKLIPDPRYNFVFYVGRDSSIWKTENNGSSYHQLYSFKNGNTVWRFEVCRSNPDIIYVCTKNGFYKSTDAGKSFNLKTLPVNYYYYNTDVAVNPENENEVYICMANGAAKEKVFYSSNGGTNWTNITGNVLNGYYVAYLQYQGGTKGGVYAIASKNSVTKVFYRDNSMSDWIDFSNGLPQNFYARLGGQIFYRDSKLRITGSRGVWESPLFGSGNPVAQPMSDKQVIACDKDTVRFYCYSMIDYKNAKWNWSFPGASWVSDSNSPKPKVLYPSIGKYNVTLKVTNAEGKTSTKTINEMISFTDNLCGSDSVAGKALKMNFTSQRINLGTVNINSNNFTISCWIKPKGNQNSFAQIVSHYGCPGSPNYGLGLGFTFSGYTPNLQLCYTDQQVNYGNYSGLVCDTTKWNHVALSYTPDGVFLYLNGIAAKVNSNKMPVLDLSQSPFFVNADIHNQGGKYNGLIDEIKFYNYALSQEEIREKMHLIPYNPMNEKGLIKYFQFNQTDQLSMAFYDVINGSRAEIDNNNIEISNAPVSTGRSFRLPAIDKSGKYSFENADIDLYLKENGIYPDGEVVAFHLDQNPDTKPNDNQILDGYYILNNFGKNKTIDPPDSIIFKNLKIRTKYFEAGNFSIFNRLFNDLGNSWSKEMDSAKGFTYKINSSELKFEKLNLQKFGQLVISDKNQELSDIEDQGNKVNENLLIEAYPNPVKNWIYLKFNSKVSEKIGISIIDLNGEIINSFTENINFGENILMLNTSNLYVGTYIIKVNSNSSQNQTIKFIKE